MTEPLFTLEPTEQTEKLVQLILTRLNQVGEVSATEFKRHQQTLGIGYCAIDDLLPAEYAQKIYDRFSPQNPAWRQMDSFREKKQTTKQFDQFDPLLKNITFAFQDLRVVRAVEKITGIKDQLPDKHLYAGGLSMMGEGDFLDPHIDNSHDQFQKVYRRLNLLYYITPDWKLESGGNLELWDQAVKSPVTIHSAFNRLVLMETHRLSWHSVSKVVGTKSLRGCVSNYYFSEASPNGQTYTHVTSFMARPNQPLKRIFCQLDNQARSLIRRIKKSGFGKTDVYIQKD